jgi:hypothetical protein
VGKKSTNAAGQKSANFETEFASRGEVPRKLLLRFSIVWLINFSFGRSGFPILGGVQNLAELSLGYNIQGTTVIKHNNTVQSYTYMELPPNVDI